MRSNYMDTMRKLPTHEAKTSRKTPKPQAAAATAPEHSMRGVNRPRVKMLKGHDATCFHIVSRLDASIPLLDEIDREALVSMIRKQARFTGVEVLNYCVLGNHFHLLVRVPDREQWLKPFRGKIGEKRLMQHLLKLYNESFVTLMVNNLKNWREKGKPELAERFVECSKARLCDLSPFFKDLKTRFTRWYHRRHGGSGDVWWGKFQSVVVEDSVEALRTVAGYLDLNPVRAGIVDDAADYRWCGWAAAQADERAAVAGLCDVMGAHVRQWPKVSKDYGSWLKQQQGNPKGLLMNRMRALGAGVAVGGEAFVEEVFQQQRKLFGPKRQRGAIKLEPEDGGSWSGLYTMRQLKAMPLPPRKFRKKRSE